MGTISRFPVPEPGADGVPWERVFHRVGVPLWIADITAVRQAIDQVAPGAPGEFSGWLDAHPEFITRVISLIEVIDVNEAAVRLFGAADRNELIRSLDRLVLPESLPIFKGLVLSIFDDREYFADEGLYLGLNGRPCHTLTRLWLPSRSDPCQQLVLATVDITDLKVAQRALTSSEERYRLLIESIGDVIVRHDLSGRITFINQAGLDLIGLPREKIIGRNALDLVPRDLVAEVLARRKRRQRGQSGVFLYETAFVDSAGRQISLEVSSTVITNPTNGGGDPEVLICARNISERKLLEREKVQLDSRVRAAHKLESLAALAGGVAHDFNNMLGTIMGNAELIATMLPAGSEIQARLETILEVAEQAADLCRQMHSYAGDHELTCEIVDLSEVVAGTQRLLEAAGGATTDILFQLAEDLPLVSADPSQIRQVLLNLVTNGAEACSGLGGGEVVVRTGERNVEAIDLHADIGNAGLTTGPHVFCEVRDSGRGMESGAVVRIFDPFFTTKDDGRGLGLSAALGIIRGHGGGFLVDSAMDRGTTVTFLLPVPIHAPVKKERRRRRRDPVAEPFDFTGRMVLVVEKEPHLRGVAVSFLRRLGCRALAAGDGFEAVRVFGVRHNEIDVVLLDLNMAGLDGPDTCRRMRVIRPDVPVIFTSGYDLPEVLEKADDLQFSGFIGKPFNLRKIGAVLAEVLTAAGDNAHPTDIV